MFGMALASLRSRKGSVVGGYLALLCAAAMVCGCGVLLQTGLTGGVAPQRYAGTPTVVTADQQMHWDKIKHKHGKVKRKTKSKPLTERAWLPASVGSRLQQIPGATVIPDRAFSAELYGGTGKFVSGVNGRTVGHNWSSARLTPYRLIAGKAPSGRSQIVVDSSLARLANVHVGSRIGVQTPAGQTTYTVSGMARAASAVTEQSIVFFSDAAATRLAGHGSAVAAYGVFGASADRVEAAVRGTHAKVAGGDARGAAEFPEAAGARVKLVSMGAAIGGTALIIAVLVLLGTFALTVQQRTRELALLRAIGATPRQTRRLIGREAMLLGLAAAVPGALLGLPLGGVIRAKFVQLGAIPDNVQLSVSPFPVAAAVVATVGAAVVASRIAGRRIGRIRPAEALAESVVERPRTGVVRVAAGLVCAAGAATLTFVLTVLHTEPAAMPVTYLCVLLWMTAVALLGPVLARIGVALLGPLARTSRVGGFLAAENSRRNSRRVASVLAPAALLVGMTATILFAPTTLRGAADAQLTDGLKAQHVVAPTGPGVPDSAVQRMRRTPGVDAAVAALNSTIWTGKTKRSAQGMTPNGLTQVIDPRVVHGSLDKLHGNTIAMSSLAAEGHSVGDQVRVTLGDGTKATYQLVAVYQRGLGFGDTLLPFDTLRRHVDDPLAASVLVAGRVSDTQLRARLANLPGVQVMNVASYRDALAAQHRKGDDVSFAFLALVLAFCGIAVVNTLAMATAGRGKEFSLIRLVGATVRQVREMLRWELALVLLLATLLGSGAAWLTLSGFSSGMVGSATPTVSWGSYAVLLAVLTMLAGAAVLVPARRMLHRRAMGALGSGR